MFHNNIDRIENQERALLEVSILKEKLIGLFQGYKSSRVGLLTSMFRDKNLTAKKIMIVDEVIKSIHKFEGSKEEFIDMFRMQRLENAELSREHNKFHYNLLERREKYIYGDVYMDVKKGESANKSGLAALFHDAIEILTRSNIPQFRNYLRQK